MANRNVSQLPENTAPQDSDWLLGASGNSPSVLQKIPVNAIIFPLDLTQAEDGKSIKWSDDLQTFVFFSPSSSSSSSSFFVSSLIFPALFITDYFQNGTVNARGF